MSTEFYLVYLAFIVLISSPGIFLCCTGYIWKGMRERTVAMDPVAIGAGQSGVVKITGDAESTPDESLKETPITGTESIIYEVEIENWVRGEHGYKWSTAYEERAEEPFVVEDQTGTALVDPAEIEGIYLDDEYQETIEERWEASPEVIELLDTHGLLDCGIIEKSKVRWTERVIEPGEQVVVVGDATQPQTSTGAHAEADVVMESPGLWRRLRGTQPIISDMAESDLLQEWQRYGQIGLFAGAVWMCLVIVGFVLLPVLL